MSYLARSNAEWVSFDQIRSNHKSNTYLICKADNCSKLANEYSPIFNFSIDELKKRWDQMIAQTSNTALLYDENHSNHRIYVQYSKFWSFPDLIQVSFSSIHSGQSTIQLYSRSLLGYYDFDVNKIRLQKWLSAIKE